MAKRIKRPEELIHRAIADYLALIAPRGNPRAPFIWFHVPNGGGRSKVEGAILKSMGTLAGVPDVLIIRPNGTVCFGEIKPGTLGLSDSQQAFEQSLYDLCFANARLDVWRSVDACKASLIKWGLI